MTIDIETKNGLVLTPAEEGCIERQLELVKQKYADANSITATVTCEGDELKIAYNINRQKFERIRRITGYLVGTIDRWNNAKKAEESDRLAHNPAM